MVREQSENDPRMVREWSENGPRWPENGPKACWSKSLPTPGLSKAVRNYEAYPRMLRIVQVSNKPARGVRDELDKVVQHDWRLGRAWQLLIILTKLGVRAGLRL